MPPTTDRQRREERQKSLLGLALLLFLALVVFLLLPGMTLMALATDLFGLSLQPSQMWAFSFALSVCIFVAVWACAADTLAAGKVYLVLSGSLATIFVALLFGFQAEFAVRWVERFAPPSETAGTRTVAASETTASDAAGGNEESPGMKVRRAIPVAQAGPLLKSIGAEPVEAPAVPIFYSVAGVARGDALNVRSGPGATYEVTDALPNGRRNIQIVGAPVMNDTTEWVNIQYGDRAGWVRKQYLREE